MSLALIHPFENFTVVDSVATLSNQVGIAPKPDSTPAPESGHCVPGSMHRKRCGGIALTLSSVSRAGRLVELSLQTLQGCSMALVKTTVLAAKAWGSSAPNRARHSKIDQG
ncbi:hypothetical protein [Brevundimonas sp. LM2]|uniref:hypothetical protein n=1 Tax=Brevundimonas sp. LM2 TaxID=1938605 RepID=UPI0012377BC8|nr:hypothetical protein [Brevundimonas sp. LM2]